MLMEELVSAYHAYCFLNSKKTQKVVGKIGLDTTVNKIVKRQVSTTWIVVICKIYEKPSEKNTTNVNIHKFITEMKEQIIPLSEQIGTDKDELLQEINEIERKIELNQQVINIAYLIRNKSLAHLDTKLLLPTLSSKLDIHEQSIANKNKLSRKLGILKSELYKLTEFTIDTLNYLIKVTENMGFEEIKDVAYKSPEIIRSQKEISKFF